MDDGSDWNDAFIDIANADDPELREVGQSFSNTSMSESVEAIPFQERALSICDDGGFEAKPTGD